MKASLVLVLLALVGCSSPSSPSFGTDGGGGSGTDAAQPGPNKYADGGLGAACDEGWGWPYGCDPVNFNCIADSPFPNVCTFACDFPGADAKCAAEGGSCVDAGTRCPYPGGQCGAPPLNPAERYTLCVKR